MVLISILISTLLFSYVVLADRRREHSQSTFLNRVEEAAADSPGGQYTNNWAGSVFERDGETINFITGTFTIPLHIPDGVPNATATAWVGIDGSRACNDSSGLLQGGIDLSPDGEGGIACAAWYEWYPDFSFYFSDITVFAGHRIRVNVTALSTKTGRVTIENLSNGQTVRRRLGSHYPICRQTAEWIVEDYVDGHGNRLPFANFTTITFDDAVALGASGSYTPDEGGILDIKQNDRVLTSVSTNQTSVTIKYV